MQGRLLNHFETLLNRSGIPGTGEGTVCTGGEGFRAAGKGVWFELRAEPGEPAPSSELAERRPWTVTVSVCFPPGGGISRGLGIASKVAAFYVPYDARLGAFRLGGARFYVADVSADGSCLTSGAVRIPVRFRLTMVRLRKENLSKKENV